MRSPYGQIAAMENLLDQPAGHRLDASERAVDGSRSYDQVARLCATFIAESAQSAAPPAIGDYLLKVAADSRPTLLRNLLHLELARRRGAGEQPVAEEYVDHLPEFSALIRQVFYETVTMIQARPLTTPGVPRSKSQPRGAPPAPFLGNYVILRELGRGGMGAVYEAEHIQRKYRVALKTLPALDGQRLHRFKREFRAVAHVNHPNLIGLHSLESDGAHWFLTMDLIEGTDFLSYVRPRGQFDEQRLRNALPQLVGAILALHGQHIIHRDLKPSNVMVTGDGQVVVLDFGLVMELQQGQSDAPAGIEGTPRYMSPEQAQGTPVTGAADWYAVGIMLYEALSGEPPFQGATLAELLHRKVHEDAPPLPAAGGAAPDLTELAELLVRRNPDGRPDPLEIARRVSFSVGSPGGVSGTPSGGQLIGRNQQLNELHAAHEEVRRRGQPSIVFVRGRSGEGKTSLIEHFLDESRERLPELTVLAGRCYDRESVPFKALDDLIDALTAYLRGLPDRDVESLLPDDIAFLAYLFPVLQRVDAVERVSRRGFSSLDQFQVRARGFAALRELLGRVTQRRAVILFADDLHWGDSDSAEVLFEVLKGPEAPAILFIGSYRSDEADTSPFLVKWASLGTANPDEIRVEHVSVGPLTAAETTHLTIAVVGQDNEQVRRRALEFAQQTGGNPFLLTELISCYDPGIDSFRAMPIHEVIDNKLSRLPSEAASLLDVIAVSGQALAWEEALQSTGHLLVGVSVITHMKNEKLVRLIGRDDDAKVDTYHDKIRETVLERIEGARRRELHHTLAHVIAESVGGRLSSEQMAALDVGSDPPELNTPARVYDLAYHFDAAGDCREACAYALLAGEQASRQFSQQVAAAQFAIARRNAPEGNARLRFRIARGEGRALSLLGRYAEANAALDGVVSLSTDPFQQAQVLGLQGEIAHKQGRIEQGMSSYSNALRKLGHWVPASPLGLFCGLVREATIQALHSFLPKWCYCKKSPLNSQEELAVELANRNSIVSYYSNGLRMIWSHLKGLNLAEASQSPRGLAYAYGLHPAPIAVIGLFARGLRYNDQALEIAEQAGDLLLLGHSYTMRSMGLWAAAQYPAVLATAKEGLDVLKRAGDQWLIFLAELHAALSNLRHLRISEAIDGAVSGFERAVQIGEDASAGGMLMVIALATRGNFPFTELRACLRISDDNHIYVSLVGLAQGIWHCHAGRWKEAVTSLEDACAIAKRHYILCPYTVSALIWLVAAQRQYAESSGKSSTLGRQIARRAKQNAHFALRLTRLFAGERSQALREYGLLLCDSGRPEKGIANLRESVRIAEAQGDAWNRVHSAFPLAQAQVGVHIPGAVGRMHAAESVLARIAEEIDESRRTHWPAAEG